MHILCTVYYKLILPITKWYNSYLGWFSINKQIIPKYHIAMYLATEFIIVIPSVQEI